MTGKNFKHTVHTSLFNDVCCRFYPTTVVLFMEINPQATIYIWCLNISGVIQDAITAMGWWIYQGWVNYTTCPVPLNKNKTQTNKNLLKPNQTKLKNHPPQKNPNKKCFILPCCNNIFPSVKKPNQLCYSNCKDQNNRWMTTGKQLNLKLKGLLWGSWRQFYILYAKDYFFEDGERLKGKNIW